LDNFFLEKEGGTTLLKQRFGILLQKRYPEKIQLPQAYLALLSYLIGFPTLPLEPYQMPNGSTCIDVLGLEEGGQIPLLVDSADLGILWMVLGVVLKEEKLLYAGIRLAIWQFYSLDHLGSPHLSLWMRGAKTYDTKRLSFHNRLLFLIAHHITGEPLFLQQASSNDAPLDSFSEKMLRLVSKGKSRLTNFSYRPFTEEMTVGFLKFTTSSWSMACSLSGWNSGIFSYHKKRLAILNAAPQKKPLDDLSFFGISRSCSLNTRRFKDVLWEKTSRHFCLKGWTKMHACSTWMEAEFRFQAQKLALSCFFQENAPLKDIFFSFYCSGKTVIIGGKIFIQSGGLKKYQGKAEPLELSLDEESIFIEPSQDQQMEVIPLSGGVDFFGADFLIAFSSENNFLQYSIK
jgi:hypothetical protein